MTEAATRSSSAALPADYLAGYARTQPEKLAVIADSPGGETISWTYAELNSRVNRLANALLRSGIEPGRSTVLWCGMNSPNVVLLVQAARKLGITSVPLNYRLTEDEAAYVADHSDATLFWIDSEQVPMFEAIQDRLPKLERIVVYGGALGVGMESAEDFVAGSEDSDPPPPEVQYKTMIYTSGTTGKPKGAVRSGQGDPEQLRGMIEVLGYTPSDIYITTGPLYHSGPGGFMGIAFLLGQTVVLQRRFDPEDWLRLVEKYQVTSTFSAPTPIRKICGLPLDVKTKYERGSMRVMVANAAPWTFALKERYLAYFPEESLFEVYGSTELGVNMILRPEDQRRKPGSCGKPAPFVDVRLVGEQGEEVTEPGVPGEVFVRSRSLYDTYHRAHDKYEEERRGDFHTVGDIAYIDDEGFYFICDRKKDMIISGGMNIYPAEIEAALEANPFVFEAAVFGIPDEEWGEKVHAVIVTRPGAVTTEKDIGDHARSLLAGYKVPRSFSFAEELPKTGSGKVLKRQLREPFWHGQARRV